MKSCSGVFLRGFHFIVHDFTKEFNSYWSVVAVSVGEGKEEGDTVDHVVQNWNDCGVDNYGTSIWIFFLSRFLQWIFSQEGVIILLEWKKWEFLFNGETHPSRILSSCAQICLEHMYLNCTNLEISQHCSVRITWTIHDRYIFTVTTFDWLVFVSEMKYLGMTNWPNTTV